MIRAATTVVVVALAAVAAVVSYRHAYLVVSVHGEAGFTAYLVPLTIDGAIFASSMVLLDAARRRLPVPALARWTLALGIMATLAANVAHGWAHGPVGAIVAAWPAVALVLSYELLMGLIRRGAVPAAAPVEAVAVPVQVTGSTVTPDREYASEEIPETNRAHWRDLVEGAGVAADSGLDETDTQDLAEWGKGHGLVDSDSGLIDAQRLVEWAKERAASVRAGTVEEGDPGTSTAGNPTVEAPDVPALPAPSPAKTPVLAPVADELFPVAADRYADTIAAGQTPSISRIKRELRVGQPRAARIRAYLGQLAQA